MCGVFFFQAEDGIRDKLVTGVQTCALPICYTAYPFTMLVVVGVMTLLFGYVVRSAVAFRRLPVASGPALLVGTIGVAKTDLAPAGIVRAGGDEWTAVSEGGPIPQGAAVRVRRVDGVRLIVGPEALSSGRRES